MRIEFDPAKDRRNLQVHGVRLSAALWLDWGSLLASEDERRDYGEPRMVGFAFLATRLYCVVFVDRGEVRRIISLRKANSREVHHYEQSQAL